MMHYEQSVAVICDKNKKPFRELDAQKVDNGRKAKVFIPFDTEYQFLVKNNSDKRIMVRIDIDGSNVSGNGLILDAYASEYIERFVDIAKKFKFVKATNEGVSDPSNKENGIVKIRIAKERKKDNPVVIEHHHHHYDWDQFYGRRAFWPVDPPYSPILYTSDKHTMIGSAGLAPSQQDAGYNCDTHAGAPCSLSSYESVPALYSGVIDNSKVTNLNCCASMPLESGATIEGNASNQIFSVTTWNGAEDTETVFTFHLFGTTDTERENKMKEYLKLKAELGI